MTERFQSHIDRQLNEIRAAGLEKRERILTTPQQASVGVRGRQVLNLCANNYLGLARHPEVLAAAKKGLEDWGFGLASVRFICGTQSPHKGLEAKISAFVGMDDAILYSSCFDANGGLFETLLTAEDAIISDSLNHASIIDGVRLCKAQRYRYANRDMSDLETKLKEADAAGTRFKLIATDGVFSMDGYIANLADICELADRYDALVMVDDSHATGFTGKTGRGTPEHCGVSGRIDILTGTFGKALGGASGGYVAAQKPIVDLLRQRSRPYLFSNTLPPPVVAGTMKAIDLLSASTQLRDRLETNTKLFRERMSGLGFEILPGEHPIVPIMFHDAPIATAFADRMLEKGVYVIAFSYPVVPLNTARIRTQISAAHTETDLNFAIEQFAAAKRELGLKH